MVSYNWKTNCPSQPIRLFLRISLKNCHHLCLQMKKKIVVEGIRYMFSLFHFNFVHLRKQPASINNLMLMGACKCLILFHNVETMYFTLFWKERIESKKKPGNMKDVIPSNSLFKTFKIVRFKFGSLNFLRKSLDRQQNHTTSLLSSENINFARIYWPYNA